MERRQKGVLIRWNNDKGYGFIRSHNDHNDIFLHIKALPHYQRRPKINDLVTYEVAIDEKQQHYARYAKIKGIAWSYFTLIWLSLSLCFLIYIALVFRQRFPFHPVAIYAAMSLLTIWAYSKDKSAAQFSRWRTSERKLHILELLGGWPGALLAQLYYRHKSRKISYQLIFWLIVTSHCVLWYYIVNHQETYRHYQQIVIEKVELFVNQSSISSNKQVIKGHRSIIIPDNRLHIVKGIVKEIRPREGVIVSLQLGKNTKGIIDKSTLANNFSTLFTPEESILVAIHTIKMTGDKERIELILVE